MHVDTTAPLTFGMLVFDEVEVLDMGGPFEVFSTAGRLARTEDGPLLRVLTVAAADRPVRCRGGLRVVADHTLDEDPPFDVLVIPGGVTAAVEADANVIDWLARRRQTSVLTFTICTGAFLLASTGALDGRPATTHWEDQEELARRWPAVRVRTDVRWVDDGDIVTSAGISAGIDASLHIVSRLAGERLARRTATQMEYTWAAGPIARTVPSGGTPPRSSTPSNG
ncbi:DJ-1/PfpI family protein [Streptomyces roseolilacinus]|uniref:Glutamine amidotransferase n=1 Tax=Streptomyces roseolilacinus TaxID=66904 RepID=A0A918AY43_9ACTN|nr:DJ-1/PfpI family protein [Streptomyces roseolilacinus]GGP97332.1 glutamine amidotransferase [Streptomyces roseolilacinus]